MKTAFAHWDGRIAPVFDTARQIYVIETESGEVVAETRETLPDDLITQKALHLVSLGIGTLVCGAISRSMHGVLTAYGIRVMPFVAGDLPVIIRAWRHGNLTEAAYAMPGCHGKGQHRFRVKQNMNQEVNIMKGRGTGTGQCGGKRQGQRGKGAGRMGSSTAGVATANCVCPQCGQKEPHQRGIPCFQRKCPQCGSAMTRQ